MNEEKIERLLTAYGDSLGTCSRVPSPTPPRRRPILLVGAVAGLTLIVVVAALWPRDAVAGTLRRVGLAIKNASTMEIVSEARTNSGKWYEFAHTFYKDGNWRFENRKGRALAATIVVKGDQALTEYDRLDHATLEEADQGFYSLAQGENLSALDFVTQKIDTGRVGIERQASLAEHPPVGGRETYAIVMTRAEDGYASKIVVDRQTDLPISSETRVEYDGKSVNQYREAYRFNHALDDSQFALTSSKPVVRLDQAQRELAIRWRRPQAVVGDAQVRDACVTSDGTVWIAVTTKANGSAMLPTRLVTHGGSEYTRTQDIVPSSILGKAKRWTLDGEDVVMVGFIPLNPSVAMPSRVEVVFASREAHYPGFSAPTRRASSSNGKVAVLDLRRETQTDRPAYFVALDLDHFGFQLPIAIWQARADALRETGRWLEAAKAYEQTAVEYRGFVKYAGYRALREAGKCYRELGMIAEAERVEKESTALKASGER